MSSFVGTSQLDQADHPYPWFAIGVRTKFEVRVAQLLGHKGYECFVPTYSPDESISRPFSRRFRVLFPGYLFCRLDVAKRLPVLTTPGVVNILGVGSEPSCLEEAEITSIREAVRRRFKLTPLPEWVPGKAVYICNGPLRGLSGLLCEVKKRNRLIVTVNILQRSVMIEVDGSDVKTPMAWIDPGGCHRNL